MLAGGSVALVASKSLFEGGLRWVVLFVALTFLHPGNCELCKSRRRTGLAVEWLIQRQLRDPQLLQDIVSLDALEGKDVIPSSNKVDLDFAAVVLDTRDGLRIDDMFLIESDKLWHERFSSGEGITWCLLTAICGYWESSPKRLRISLRISGAAPTTAKAAPMPPTMWRVRGASLHNILDRLPMSDPTAIGRRIRILCFFSGSIYRDMLSRPAGIRIMRAGLRGAPRRWRPRRGRRSR